MKEESIYAFVAGLMAAFTVLLFLSMAYYRGYDTGKREALRTHQSAPAK